MKTHKIHLDHNSPFIYGAVFAVFLLLVLFANRITATVNIQQNLEMCRESVIKNSAMLEGYSLEVYDMVQWAEKSDIDLYKFYRSVNDSRILGKPMR